MTALYLFDDARARTFEPFALTRPVSELRAGAEIIRARWERALDGAASASLSSPWLIDFEEDGAPSGARGEIPAGALIVNARCVPSLANAIPEADAWSCEGRIAAVRLATPMPTTAFADGSIALDALATAGARRTEIAGWWLDEVWDLIRHLQPILADDIAALSRELDVERVAGAHVLGEHDALVERGATVEPFVVFDVGSGPVLVRRGAHVQACSRLVGPCLIGAETTVHGGKITGSSIGERCRVHGEVSTTVFLGCANKSHEGFVGHSYLGRWVNLGASTVTSNLKNTYGEVALWTPSGVRTTGLQFLGTMFGDHAKTAIGTRLTTGSVVGAGANVFGGAMTAKMVPPFAWGGDGEVYSIDRFLQVAERAMARRQVALGDRARRVLSAAYDARWG